MKNIFILYMPVNNYEAMVHYQDTIVKKVDQDSVFKYLNQQQKQKIKTVFGNNKLTIWGSRDSESNRGRFNRMNPGDDILIVEGNTIKLIGKVALTTVNKDLSNLLWKNIKGGTDVGWDLIYFIANPKEVDLPFEKFTELFGYSSDYQLRGFTNVSEERLKFFYAHYDDLYSILLRLKNNEEIKQYEKIEAEKNTSTDNNVEDESTTSDHVLMQYNLLKLGERLGTKVWLPKNDQTKVQSQFGDLNIENEFTSGLDVPKSIENIDVVWKDGYRIDAAFEVENSTSVYSGLLRFSDLKVLTPNSTYPLFIVAPSSRKNKVISEANRPTFKKLNIDREVKYISYENITNLVNTKKQLSFSLVEKSAEALF